MLSSQSSCRGGSSEELRCQGQLCRGNIWWCESPSPGRWCSSRKNLNRPDWERNLPRAVDLQQLSLPACLYQWSSQKLHQQVKFLGTKPTLLLWQLNQTIKNHRYPCILFVLFCSYFSPLMKKLHKRGVFLFVLMFTVPERWDGKSFGHRERLTGFKWLNVKITQTICLNNLE